MQGRWVAWENSFSERLWVQESEGWVILTTVEEGYDPSVAIGRVKAHGCDHMGIIEGPYWYSTRLGTQEELVFRETLGENVPVGPRIGVLGACDSASLPETGAKHRGATP